MKAAVFRGINEITVEEVPRPRPEPGGVLVNVSSCAICGTDLRIYRHGHPRIHPPRIIGHEVAGTIIGIGDGIPGLAEGDRVIVAPAFGCGRCASCLSGGGNICPDLTIIGYEYDGGFTEVMAVPRRAVAQGHVIGIPPGLPMKSTQSWPSRWPVASTDKSPSTSGWESTWRSSAPAQSARCTRSWPCSRAHRA